MIVIGLTGSIGMGKSTVARLFTELGIPCHDADAAVHAALSQGGAAVEAVGRLFPDVVEDGAINRQKLGRIVFNDDEKLRALEDILHPLARASSDAFLENCRAEAQEFAVLDIPLLFETGAENRVDVTICVSAPYDAQRARVLARPGMNEEKFAQILARQMSDAEKRNRADFVIDTGVSIDETRKQLIALLDNLAGL